MSEITTKVVKTKNVKNAIEAYALNNSISPDECDFSIKKIETYIKTRADAEFLIYNGNIQAEFDTKEKILNKHLEVHQLFIIAITQSSACEIKLNYTLDFGEYSTHPKIIISPNSHIPYKLHPAKYIYFHLVKEINKIKALNGILIDIYDEAMMSTLKQFTKYIYAGKFIKKIKIPLFEGIEPTLSRQSHLIMWFQHKDMHQQVIEVEEDEVLVEFKKPIYGQNGFNAFGAQIDNIGGGNKNDLEASIDPNSIKIEENADRKLYKSKKKGYVHFDTKTLTVNNKVKMEKLSRIQDTVAKDEDNNIEVHVSQHDTNKDSIGEGVKLTSETIHVTGHIGAKSTLEAINLQIDGATHKDSLQFAKFAKINRHKGTLRCQNAEIALLEGGTVHATNINVESSLGGVIYAQNVTIGTVKNNLKVYASNSITIKLVSGEDNLFKINYRDIPILNSKISLINEDIAQLKETLEVAQRHNISEVPQIKEKIKKFQDELSLIQNSTKNAKISIEKPLRGLNTIIFTIDTNHEIIYKTDAKQYDPFYLEINESTITLQPVKRSISL